MLRSANQFMLFCPVADPKSERPAKPRKMAGAILSLVAALFSELWLGAQTTAPTQPAHPTSIIRPEANRPPDKNEQMRMEQKKLVRQNFDAANALRAKQIAEESTKLLILANDLKAHMQNLGNGAMTKRLMREAEVIEFLAHDVQTKMTLTVGGS